MAKAKTEKEKAEAKAAAKVKADAKAKAKAEKERKLPEIKDSEGLLRKLKSSDFPKTKEGKMAYCDYNIEKWTVKKTAVEKGADPKTKKLKRREKLLSALKELDESIAKDE